jgi:hypothetical protein
MKMPSPNDKIWYVVVHGKADGPHKESEIRERLDKGKLSFSDLVFRPGLTKWVPIIECPEFERRTELEFTGKTAAKLEIPKDVTSDGWILLVKQNSVEGKHHYIQSGPYTADQVRDKLTKSEIQYDDHVWRKGMIQWTVIGELDDFDRRRPMTFELHPKPTIANSQPPPVTMDVKTAQGKGSTASAVPKDTSAADEVTESKDDPTAEVPKKSGRARFQRAGIGLAGGCLGMLLAYAGVVAYKQNLQPQNPLTAQNANQTATRQVANDAQAFQPPAQAPAVLPAPAAAVNPEMAERVAKKPQVIKIVPLKLATAFPQLAFETDVPGGTKLEVEISASAGTILKYPSFYLKKELTVANGQVPTMDLSADRLPPGDYRVIVSGGGLRAFSSIALGNQDQEYRQKLAAFKKVVLKKQKEESAFLQKGTTFAGRSLTSFDNEYKKFRGKPLTSEARKKWNKLLKAWRKDLNQELKSLRGINSSNRNAHAYPEQLLKLKSVAQGLLDISRVYDQSLKNGRQIASDADPVKNVRSAIQDLQKELRGLKGR